MLGKELKVSMLLFAFYLLVAPVLCGTCCRRDSVAQTEAQYHQARWNPSSKARNGANGNSVGVQSCKACSKASVSAFDSSRTLQSAATSVDPAGNEANVPADRGQHANTKPPVKASEHNASNSKSAATCTSSSNQPVKVISPDNGQQMKMAGQLPRGVSTSANVRTVGGVIGAQNESGCTDNASEGLEEAVQGGGRPCGQPTAPSVQCDGKCRIDDIDKNSQPHHIQSDSSNFQLEGDQTSNDSSTLEFSSSESSDGSSESQLNSTGELASYEDSTSNEDSISDSDPVGNAKIDVSARNGEPSEECNNVIGKQVIVEMTIKEATCDEPIAMEAPNSGVPKEPLVVQQPIASALNNIQVENTSSVQVDNANSAQVSEPHSITSISDILSSGLENLDMVEFRHKLKTLKPFPSNLVGSHNARRPRRKLKFNIAPPEPNHVGSQKFKLAHEKHKPRRRTGPKPNCPERRSNKMVFTDLGQPVLVHGYKDIICPPGTTYVYDLFFQYIVVEGMSQEYYRAKKIMAIKVAATLYKTIFEGPPGKIDAFIEHGGLLSVLPRYIPRNCRITRLPFPIVTSIHRYVSFETKKQIDDKMKGKWERYAKYVDLPEEDSVWDRESITKISFPAYTPLVRA